MTRSNVMGFGLVLVCCVGFVVLYADELVTPPAPLIPQDSTDDSASKDDKSIEAPESFFPEDLQQPITPESKSRYHLSDKKAPVRRLLTDKSKPVRLSLQDESTPEAPQVPAERGSPKSASASASGPSRSRPRRLRRQVCCR